MKVDVFTVGNFGVNTYLLTDEATGQSAIIDTGETRELRSSWRSVRRHPISA